MSCKLPYIPLCVFLCHDNVLSCLIFCTAFWSITPVTLLLFLTKKGPGEDLIRVDLIRFPGSIPGAMQDAVHQLTYSNYT